MSRIVVVGLRSLSVGSNLELRVRTLTFSSIGLRVSKQWSSGSNDDKRIGTLELSIIIVYDKYFKSKKINHLGWMYLNITGSKKYTGSSNTGISINKNNFECDIVSSYNNKIFNKKESLNGYC